MRVIKRDRCSESVRIEDALMPLSMADFDEADYLPHLDGLDLTPTQKSDLLRALWDLCRTAVEMEFPDENATPQVGAFLAEKGVRP